MYTKFKTSAAKDSSNNSVNAISDNKSSNGKFKKTLSAILCMILICIIAFGYGYYRGSEHIKNQKITEIKYNLSADYDLDDWQVFELATAMTESEFNPYAVGKSNDCGIIQITPVYVKDVNRISGKHYQLVDAFDIKKSWEMFSIMQAHYNPDYDIDKAMHLHNPGGASIKYFDNIYKNIVFIKRMEAVRKEVLLNKFYKSDNIVITDTAEKKPKPTADEVKIIKTIKSSTSVDSVKIK